MCSDTHALTEATMVNESIIPDGVPVLESLAPQDSLEEIEIPPKEDTSTESVPYTNSSVEDIPNDATACNSNAAAPITTDVKSQVSDLKKWV